MTKTMNKFVIFLDILGFSNLTLDNEVDIVTIKRNHGTLDERFGNLFREKENRLTEVFSNFHNSLENGLSLARLSCHFNSITFSDSAFIATLSIKDAVSVIGNLMCTFMRNEVPVRAGIAMGSFETIRFKSDIMSDSSEHSAHFLGTGVVRSCQTEACGIKGMRILVHPSVEEVINEKSQFNNFFIQDCSSDELDNSIGVTKEINYWDFNVTDERTAWRSFQKMWRAAPENSKHHYEATAEVIQKMRIHRGYPIIKDLKKMSITRKTS